MLSGLTLNSDDILSGLTALLYKSCFPKSIHSLFSKNTISQLFLSSNVLASSLLLFLLSADNLISYFIEKLEREISLLPTSDLTVSIHTLRFPPVETHVLSPAPFSRPAPPLENWILFPLTLLKNSALKVFPLYHQNVPFY